MSRIFISHSSQNNAQAEQLRDWIVEEFGEKEVFLDLDPRQGLAPGERWKDALKKAAHRCQVVLALISQDWLRSRYCQAELATATLLGKRVISIILDSTLIEELPADLTDTQFVRLDDSHWKSRLREGLRRARLDPAAFAVDESRPPYPGLRALEEEDAAIFFGRDAELVRADSELRLIRERGVQRILLIVGASGSGKSSFLRAGLWRRLERDDTSYFILPVVRPDGAVLTGRDGLDGALERALTDPRVKGRLEDALPSTRGDIADALFQDPDSLTRFASALAEAARIPAPGGGLGARPAVVLCIDQGEELLAVASGGHGESAILAGLLGRATGEGSDLLVLLTVRSDSLPRFEQSPHFSPLFDERLQTLSLPRLSPGNFSQIIEGPASLMRDKPLRIDPALTQKLLEDSESQPDALPLLAFTLQRLYERYGSDGDLRLDEYERFGGLLGALEAAERELRSEAREKGLAATDHEFEDQLRRVFIPHLVAVNEDAEVVRRVAELDDLPPDVRPLVEILVDRHHLLRTDMRGEEKVVEVAHEALLREWRLVDGFVQDVRVDLGRLRELTRAADSWASRGHQREYLDHKGERLLAAEKLLVDERLRSLIDEHPSAAEYIRACRRRDEDEAAEKRANRERERRDGQKILQRTRLGLAAAIGGVVVAAVLTVFATDRAREAREQTAAALEQRARAETAAFDARIQSLRAQSEQYFARANLNAIQAVKTRTLPRRPDTDAYVERLIAAMDEFREKAESALERAHELVSLPESQRSLELLAVAETTPRADSLFELEMVKAKFGTALLIRFGAPEEQRTILYGGGPPGVFKRTLRPLLANKAQAGGLARPKLDLVIAPQQDFEYLDGIDDLFKLLDEDASQGSPLSIDVGGLWHNHFAKMLHDRAEMEATPHEPFRDRCGLIARHLGVPVNQPFDYFVAASDTGPARVMLEGGLMIYVIGPTFADIEGLHKLWRERVGDRVLDGEFPGFGSESVESILDQIGGMIKGYSSPRIELIRSPRSVAGKVRDMSIVNRSSMVLLLELQGLSVLLPADSNANQILEGLTASGHLKEGSHVNLDVVMLPHSGSDRNVSKEFFRRVRADHYLIFTDGKHSKPEPKTLELLFEARAEDNRPFRIHMTYSMEELRQHRDFDSKWISKFELLEGLVEAALSSGQLVDVSSPPEGKTSLILSLEPSGLTSPEPTG